MAGKISFEQLTKEMKGIAEEETKRKIAEEETNRKIAEEETKRIIAKIQEETNRKIAEEETKRIIAEEKTKQANLLKHKSAINGTTNYKEYYKQLQVYGKEQYWLPLLQIPQSISEQIINLTKQKINTTSKSEVQNRVQEIIKIMSSNYAVINTSKMEQFEFEGKSIKPDITITPKCFDTSGIIDFAVYPKIAVLFGEVKKLTLDDDGRGQIVCALNSFKN